MLYKELKSSMLVDLGERRVGFLHIPKTAGTTFRNVLQSHFLIAEFYPFNLIYNLEDIPTEPYRVFWGHFPVTLMKLLAGEDVALITFLRNPIDRTVSQYHQLYTRNIDYPEVEPRVPETLEEYLYHPAFVPMCIDLQTQMLTLKVKGSTPSEVRQTWDEVQDAVSLTNRPSAEEAYPILESFEFVGITERFADSMSLFNYRFGWPPIEDVLKLNVRSYEKPSQSLIDRIIELNQEDIKLYDYAVRLFNARYAQMVREATRLHHVLAQMATTPRRYEWHSQFVDIHPIELVLDGEWYPIEHYKGTPFRWTGPSKRAVLRDVPLASGRDLQVKVVVLSALTPDILESLQCIVNDYSVPLTRTLTPEGRHEFQGIIPRECIADDTYFSQIALEVDHTVRAIDVDPTNHDERYLGIALISVDITPVPMPPAYQARLWTDVASYRVAPTARHQVAVYAENIGNAAWDPAEVWLAWCWLRDNEASSPETYVPLAAAVQPGSTTALDVPVSDIMRPGRYTVRVRLVRRLTEWFVTPFDTPPHTLTIEVIP